MPKRRSVGKQPPDRAATCQPDQVDDDLALAEELLRLAREDPAVVAAERKKFRRALRRLGVRLPAKPIGAKKLREMAIREGLDPEGNEFSRGIIEMREE